MSDPFDRILLGGDAYLCGKPPQAAGGGDGADVLERTWLGRADREVSPTLLYWDATIGGARLRPGPGGLDPLLAAEYDLGGCCAILESVLRRLVERGGLEDIGQIGRAAALLARDPTCRPLYCEGLIGALPVRPEPTVVRRAGAATFADNVSIIVPVTGPDVAVEAALQAIERQLIGARMEVVIVACGLSTLEHGKFSDLIDTYKQADFALKLKRFVLAGEFSVAHLIEVGAALAAGDALVVFDPRCRPTSRETFQKLADWTRAGDVVSACPRIERSGRLLAAGLAAVQGPAPALRLGSEDVLTRSTRLVAAPNPWLFAANRAALLKSQALRAAAASPLWTAALAADTAPRGRNLLIGTETAEWVDEAPPPSPAVEVAVGALSAIAAKALRGSPETPEPVPAPFLGIAPPVRTEPVAEAASERADGPVAAFSDAFPSTADLRILVFADLYAASQSIAFVDGLAGPRQRGEAAVRIVEESAFPGSSQALSEVPAEAVVEPHFAAVKPHLVVVSRFAHAAGYRAIVAAARKRGLPVLFHIDDDLFDLPVTLGLERYRLARNPKRLLSLHRALEEADLVLAATPALAERVAGLAGHGRVAGLRYGTGGYPSTVTPDEAAPVVIGYMGSASHDHDLEMVVPALNAVRARHPHVEVELFGSIAGQPAAKLLTGSVRTHKPVLGDYAGFRKRLGELGWTIGLAPLEDIAFNRTKTPTKWVEYAEAGIATVVSDICVYRPMMEAGAAIGAQPEQWEAALTRAVRDASLRRSVTAAANGFLGREFSWIQLEQELMALLTRAARTAVAAA